MIMKFTKDYEKQLMEFIYEFNNQKEYSVAWVPETSSEIEEYDKSNFLLCVEGGKIVGFLGVHLSEEQKLARLLGPIILQECFNTYIDDLYKQWLESLPSWVQELKIAFYEENTSCRNWCDKENYKLYNAERTLILNRGLFVEAKLPASVQIVSYEDKYKEGLAQVHPEGVFYTLNELISQINEHHHIVLAMENGAVTGYVHYQTSKDSELGEVVLLHVREDKRGKGYGSFLIKEVIRKMIAANIKSITTSVRVTNHDAHRLYNRIGFEDGDAIYAYRKEL